MAKRIKAKNTWFIHMNHEFGLHDEVEKSLPENIHVAYDGLKLDL
jgi:phosphoribosyl 1,2-cyclic phosphate phosphodiesterase